jgi:phytoene synthase
MPAPDVCAEIVRRHDPDRFLTALFAPADRRGRLFTLYAFNHELARARESVSVPMLALIRLQWWREVVDGAARRHEVAEPLAAAIASGALDRAALHAMLDAREAEADEAIETREAFSGYVAGGAGSLAVAAARALGARDPEAFLGCGAAYGAAGVLRSVPALARQGRCLLPVDALAAHGLTPEQVIAAPDGPEVGAVLRDLAQDGLAWLRQVPADPGAAVAAGLPAVLARRDLRRAGRAAGPRGLRDKLAVVSAGLRGVLT